MSPSTSRLDLAPATLTWRAVPEPTDRPGEAGVAWSLVLAALVVLAFYAWFGPL